MTSEERNTNENKVKPNGKIGALLKAFLAPPRAVEVDPSEDGPTQPLHTWSN